jgi:hypothetical protein
MSGAQPNTSPAPAPAQPSPESPERAGAALAAAPVDGGRTSEGGQPATAPADGQAPAPQAGGEGGEPAPQPGQKQTPEHRTVQGRISEYQRRARAAELRNAELEGELRAYRNGAGPRQPTSEPEPAPAPKGPPNPKDYALGEYDPNYAVDLAEHRIEQKLKAEREERAQADQRAAADKVFNEGLSRYRDALADAEDRAVESDNYANAPRTLQVVAGWRDNDAVDLITTADHPIEVAEVLGRNPEALRNYRGMNGVQRARYIGALDARIGDALAAQKGAGGGAPAASPKPAAAAAPQTQTPGQPIPTINPSGGAPRLDPSKLSTAEYIEARRAGRI